MIIKPWKHWQIDSLLFEILFSDITPRWMARAMRTNEGPRGVLSLLKYFNYIMYDLWTLRHLLEGGLCLFWVTCSKRCLVSNRFCPIQPVGNDTPGSYLRLFLLVSGAVAASDSVYSVLSICMWLVRVADNCQVAFNIWSNWARAIASVPMPASPLVTASPNRIEIRMSPAEGCQEGKR